MRLTVFLAFLILIVATILTSFKSRPIEVSGINSSATAPTIIPTPTPIDKYTPPQIATASSYTVIFVGDSMTGALGENFDQLRLSLSKLYPTKIFGLFNYGYGSTNILSVEQRLTQDTQYQGKTNQAILNRNFDVIILESMGTNPLSEYPLDQGLKLQTDALTKITSQIAFYHPNSVIVFLATIAPSQTHFAKGVIDITQEQRNLWANERRFYIENHINFAKTHHFPLINVYASSLGQNGNTLLKYISPSDYIHPSKAGVTLISQEIANYLFNHQILFN